MSLATQGMYSKKQFFCRSHFTPNKSKQAEAKKTAASLAVEDLRVAIVKGNITAIQKYLDDGKMRLLLSFVQCFLLV